MTRLFIALACLALLMLQPAGAQAPDPVKIGVHNLLNEVAKDKIPGLIRSFEDLVKEMTGLRGQAITGGDEFKAAEDLKEDKLHLTLFQGFEFAWVKEKYPKMKPLMIAVYYDKELRANLMVQKAGAVKKFADAKGKVVALPLSSGGHCRLFLERLCNEAGKTTPKMFFSKVLQPENAEAALDALCDDEIQCAVVDNVSLETYKLVKAGAAKRLHVLQPSEVFPPGAVAYYEGGLDAETLKRFKTGMLKANKSERAKEMMATFKITAFETVPANYDEMLANTRKIYPAPAASAASKE